MPYSYNNKKGSLPQQTASRYTIAIYTRATSCVLSRFRQSGCLAF